MTKKEEIRRLWHEGFKDSDEYLDMYFDRIYRDADALTINADSDSNRIISSLLMQPYRFLFHGKELSSVYLCGAVTRRSARGQGLMSRLMTDAIHRAADQGHMIATLIPAHNWLYYFFDRFDFSTVFLSDTQRFTARHRFSAPDSERYSLITDPYSDAVYETFSQFERQRPGGVLHSRRDFNNFLDDLAMHRGGTFVAVGRDDCPVAAMAWARMDGSVLEIFEVLGIDQNAKSAAMRSLRECFPDTPMRYFAPACHPDHRHLHSRGMARILNVGQALEAIAEANPDWRCAIRVKDQLITQNNHIFIIANGHISIDDSHDPHKLNFDVTIDVLNRIIFSSPKTGDLLNFPSKRTHITLMPH